MDLNSEHVFACFWIPALRHLGAKTALATPHSPGPQTQVPQNGPVFFEGIVPLVGLGLGGGGLGTGFFVGFKGKPRGATRGDRPV